MTTSRSTALALALAALGGPAACTQTSSGGPAPAQEGSGGTATGGGGSAGSGGSDQGYAGGQSTMHANCDVTVAAGKMAYDGFVKSCLCDSASPCLSSCKSECQAGTISDGFATCGMCVYPDSRQDPCDIVVKCLADTNCAAYRTCTGSDQGGAGAAGAGGSGASGTKGDAGSGAGGV